MLSQSTFLLIGHWGYFISLFPRNAGKGLAVVSKLPISLFKFIYEKKDHLGGVMVRVLISDAEGHGFDPQPGQTKTSKFVFAASSQSKQHLGVRAKTGLPRARIMFLGKLAWLPVDCSFRELAR